MKRLKSLSTLSAVLLFAACSTVPLTGRRQLNLANSSQIQQESLSAYRTFLTDPKTKVLTSGAQVTRVKNVGARVARAIDTYLKSNGFQNQYNFNWEFNVVESSEINAWCMPGGKVAVFTGILPVANTDAALATVMGHEIAHAIARHAEERYSQTMGAQAIGSVVGAVTKSEGIQQLYGVGGQLALLKYGRSQESEADHLGLIFMAMAGYDPSAAISFWERMASTKKGSGAPPEFLSTHPSDATRIADIRKLLPEAMKYYKK